MRLTPFLPDAPAHPFARDATLDEILARSAREAPDAVALADERGLPFDGTWAGLDRAVSSLAAEFASWGLGEDAVVGVQLGSSALGAAACLALMRAGLIPAMMPLAWRRREIAAALASVGATAIVTASEAGGLRPAEGACEVAAALDTIRFVGCFGADLPDGATPLDGAFVSDAPFPGRERAEDAAAHVAVVTFDAGAVAVARSHAELFAAGLAPLAASRLSPSSRLLSTIDLGGLAGLATGFAPWLAARCTAAFHQPASAPGLRHAACALAASHVALPGRVAAGLASEGAFENLVLTVTAVWRAPDSRGAAAEIADAGSVVDAVVVGEIGLYAAARAAAGRHIPTPLGPAGPDGLPPLVDVRITPEGRLLLRGPVCPDGAFPVAPGAQTLTTDPDGYVETGIAGVADRGAKRASLGGRRRGVLQIGGLGVTVSELDAAYRTARAGARPAAHVDPVFGLRLSLAGGGSDAAERAAAALGEAGFGPALAPVAPDIEEAGAEPDLRTA